MAKQTAREKAYELINKYNLVVLDTALGGSNSRVKRCALIAVDEIIPIVNSYENALSASQQSDYLEYWYEVKKEIEKL